MRGFFIGAGLFVAWWILMAIAFGVVGVVITLAIGHRVPEILHIVLWFVYIAAVLIGGIGVVCEKDAILAKLHRSPSDAS
jgi:hypothetical protein